MRWARSAAARSLACSIARWPRWPPAAAAAARSHVCTTADGVGGTADAQLVARSATQAAAVARAARFPP